MLYLRNLTERQIEVVKEVMKGRTNEDIALELGITTGNVKWHMTNLMRAYGVKSRSQLILKVAQINTEAI